MGRGTRIDWDRSIWWWMYDLQDAVTVASVSEILKSEISLAFGELVAKSLLELRTGRSHRNNRYRSLSCSLFFCDLFTGAGVWSPRKERGDFLGFWRNKEEERFWNFIWATLRKKMCVYVGDGFERERWHRPFFSSLLRSLFLHRLRTHTRTYTV